MRKIRVNLYSTKLKTVTSFVKSMAQMFGGKQALTGDSVGAAPSPLPCGVPRERVFHVANFKF